MKHRSIRFLSLACACLLLLGGLAGCSLTKTTITSDISTDISYIDVSRPDTSTSTGGADDTSTPSNSSSGGKTPVFRRECGQRLRG